MGCTSDLLKTGIYAAIGVYGAYKALTWNNGFWKLIATGVGGACGIQAARNGWVTKDTCNFNFKKNKRKR